MKIAWPKGEQRQKTAKNWENKREKNGSKIMGNGWKHVKLWKFSKNGEKQLKIMRNTNYRDTEIQIIAIQSYKLQKNWFSSFFFILSITKYIYQKYQKQKCRIQNECLQGEKVKYWMGDFFSYGALLNYVWIFESLVNFWIMGELLNHGTLLNYG